VSQLDVDSCSDRDSACGIRQQIHGRRYVIKSRAIRLAVFVGLAFTLGVWAPAIQAQDNAANQAPAAPSSGSSNDEQNIQEYIALLRKDVRSQKSAIMSEVMQLDPDQAAKFWPIYRDYDTALSKLNDLRVANIREYTRTYANMTDAKADQLVHNAMSYQKQRAELLAQYYAKMKDALGGTTAARFLMVESQMLLIIDLQIDSSLPIIGSNQN
jgi:hypothetical protein